MLMQEGVRVPEIILMFIDALQLDPDHVEQLSVDEV